MHGEVIGDRGEQSAELARRRGGIRSRANQKPVHLRIGRAAGQGEGAIAQSVAVKLQSGKAIRVPPKTGGDEVQRVFKIAALRLKIMRAEIHAFRPDGFVQEFHRLSTRLRQQDKQLHLWIGKISRNMYGEVARAGDRLPRGSGLVQAEVLILHLDGNGTRRAGQVAEDNSRQGKADEPLDVGGGAHLDQLRDLADDRCLRWSRRRWPGTCGCCSGTCRDRSRWHRWCFSRA